jgi:hypothetical protein
MPAPRLTVGRLLLVLLWRWAPSLADEAHTDVGSAMVRHMVARHYAAESRTARRILVIGGGSESGAVHLLWKLGFHASGAEPSTHETAALASALLLANSQHQPHPCAGADCVRQASLAHLPWEEGQFAAVVCARGLEAVFPEGTMQAARELKRVSREMLFLAIRSPHTSTPAAPRLDTEAQRWIDGIEMEVADAADAGTQLSASARARWRCRRAEYHSTELTSQHAWIICMSSHTNIAESSPRALPLRARALPLRAPGSSGPVRDVSPHGAVSAGADCERHLMIGADGHLSGHGKLWEVSTHHAARDSRGARTAAEILYERKTASRIGSRG